MKNNIFAECRATIPSAVYYILKVSSNWNIGQNKPILESSVRPEDSVAGSAPFCSSDVVNTKH